MIAILLVLSAAAQPPLPLQWAQFRRSGALNHITETVDIATGTRTSETNFPYTLRLTRYALRGEPVTKWTDSATCPAVRSVIASMSGITMPSPAPYGVPGRSTTITLDGAEYSLTAPSSDTMGRMTISSNVGSPLAAWIDASFQRLASCWTATAS